MELKTYTKNQNLVNIDKLTKQIASSGFVSGIVAITVFGFVLAKIKRRRSSNNRRYTRSSIGRKV